MPDFKLTDVDSQQIENTASNLDNDIKELLSVCSIVKHDVMANLNFCWQGQAKQSFEQQFNLFTANLVKLVDGYKELNEHLKKAGNTYSKADESVRQLVEKLPK